MDGNGIAEEALQYDLQSLTDGLAKIDKNIAVFEEAIETERATKRRYRQMIAVLEDRQAGGG